MVQHAAGPGPGERGDGRGAALGFAVEERPVVERGSAEPLVADVQPEFEILDVVDRHLEHAEALGRHRVFGGELRLPDLVFVAEVDDGADPGRACRAPTRVRDEPQVSGPEEGAMARRATAADGQAAQIAGVVEALPADHSGCVHASRMTGIRNGP